MNAAITPHLNDCQLVELVFLCAFRIELNSDINGMEARTLKGSIWESVRQCENDFYVLQDGRTVSNGGAYILSKRREMWIDSCCYPKDYSWASDYSSQIGFSSYI